MSEAPLIASLPAAPSLSGWFAPDGTHRFPVRVYYEDTDAGGIVYHANYLRFAERARSEMLCLLGFRQTAMAAGDAETPGVSFAVRRTTIDFAAPARLEETLEVETRITDIGGASFAVAQTIRRSERPLVRVELQLVTINAPGRAVRLPGAVRAAMERLRRTQESFDTVKPGPDGANTQQTRD